MYPHSTSSTPHSALGILKGGNEPRQHLLIAREPFQSATDLERRRQRRVKVVMLGMGVRRLSRPAWSAQHRAAWLSASGDLGGVPSVGSVKNHPLGCLVQQKVLCVSGLKGFRVLKRVWWIRRWPRWWPLWRIRRWARRWTRWCEEFGVWVISLGSKGF